LLCHGKELRRNLLGWFCYGVESLIKISSQRVAHKANA